MTERRKVAVLAYHKIGPPSVAEWETWSYVSEARFETHLRYLADHGWQVIGLNALLHGLEHPDTLPARAALITFDDGYRSNYELALPLLQRFGFPAVMFVPTGFIGGYNAFDADIYYEPHEEICTLDELRALERGGVSVQSHGRSHRRLSELTPAERQEEVSSSKAHLEQALGKTVSALAFPYGDNGGDARATATMLAARGYRVAFLYGGGWTDWPVADAFSIARVPIGADTSLDEALE
jgi:peptidoglycan/xylan/chitin deacetylase (PgdA/CDA1 family)